MSRSLVSSDRAFKFGCVAAAATVLVAAACRSGNEPESTTRREAVERAMTPAKAPAAAPQERKYLLERVDDVAVVQVYADGFERLPIKDKILCWHLYQAALAGRDIYMTQRSAEGLDIRDLCEEILTHSKDVNVTTLDHVRHYMKLFWVNNSPYNNVTTHKNLMQGDARSLAQAAEQAAKNGAKLPLRQGEDTRVLVRRLAPILFDPDFKPMVTAKNPEGGLDIIQASAATYYGPGVTLAELDGFKEEYELNSNIVKDANGKLVEMPWRMGDSTQNIAAGVYADSIAKIVEHLTAALPYAGEATRKALEAQILFYKTGKREDRVAYDIAWVADKDSVVDTVNGFIEVYVDPRGKKGGWEGIVSYEDPKKAELIKSIAKSAQWFEDHMPYDPSFRKASVTGISARSIDVVIEAGDSGPVTPVGINLPNDQSVRETHGSKSVSLANIVEAYEKSTPTTARAEFAWDQAEIARSEKWQALTSDMLTNMHEVIGHASGQQAADKQGDPSTWIKENYSALEEGRADLVALYFMMDPKLKELGLLSDPDEAALAAYEQYTRNGGMQQLRRIKKGEQVEEDHMRNRMMVVRWIQANSKAIDERVRDGKHYLVVTSAKDFREAVGRLLTLVQQLKSTGDYAGAKSLFDTYGIKFDPKLRDEVLARYSKLDIASYTGFVMPRLTAVRDSKGQVTDAKVSYPLSLEQQMLEWSGRAQPPAN
jgi:dipeptidyl-peptidase-3